MNESSQVGAACAAQTPPRYPAQSWSRLDVAVMVVLLVAAAVTRFWRLGLPDQMVFDEHFTVPEARCYLSGMPYSGVHPPLPSLCIAASILLFGDHPWSWRFPGALLGTALIAITYVLARRMFGSRASATVAAMLVLCDGLFLVDSRTALWEIFYLTFAAAAYMILFRLAKAGIGTADRWSLAGIGLLLGLSFGSKFMIPAIAILLVLGSLLFIVYTHDADAGRSGLSGNLSVSRKGAAVVALVSGAAGFVYLAVFLPNYWFGWWRGVADQVNYFLRQFEFERTLIAYGAHRYASRWWSWPLMLRPMLYWTDSDLMRDSDTKVRAIRALGNPVIWWAVLAAIVVSAIRAAARKSFPHGFVVVGYVIFLAMWIPIPRYQFVYYYMPALYLGMLALADLISRCWRREAKAWEHAVVIAALSPALWLGLGAVRACFALTFIGVAYAAVRYRGERDGGVLVCGVFIATVIVCFLYFFPIWTGLPLSSAAFESRMWIHGPKPANWN